ncbi:MAG: hypothetical protein INF12_02525, partial [Methylobacterium sp.]|nr:hypothetical protein [Methylobacterium sp.]
MPQSPVIPRLPVGRRHALISLAGLALAGLALPLALGAPSFAQAQDQMPLVDVMQAGPLGDRSLGKEDAPVTIV